MEVQTKPHWLIRIFQLLTYLSLVGAGVVGLFDFPSIFSQLVGPTLAKWCGGFALAGAIIGFFGALIDEAWIERVGLLAALTAIGMFAIGIAFTGVPSIGLWLAVGFGFELTKRFVDITTEWTRGREHERGA